MILDWDVHHGNGTNDLFYEDDSVLMIDMHEDGVWPGSGLLEETGSGRGQGHTINIPMPSESINCLLPSRLHKSDISSIICCPALRGLGNLCIVHSAQYCLSHRQPDAVCISCKPVAVSPTCMQS